MVPVVRPKQLILAKVLVAVIAVGCVNAVGVKEDVQPLALKKKTNGNNN